MDGVNGSLPSVQHTSNKRSSNLRGHSQLMLDEEILHQSHCVCESVNPSLTICSKNDKDRIRSDGLDGLQELK